jgi:hypothetical protein
MARAKLRVRKHVHVPLCRNVVPTESHNDGQNARYFLRTLWTVLLALGYSEPLLFVIVPRLLRWNSYLWCVCVWSSTRGQRPIIFSASVTWSRLPHQGGCSREAWERPHKKIWCYYDMKRWNKWSNHNTTTSWATPEKELKLWWCPRDIVKLSEANSCFGLRSWWGCQGGQPARRTWRGVMPEDDRAGGPM